jgi:signal transduction histidine kinase
MRPAWYELHRREIDDAVAQQLCWAEALSCLGAVVLAVHSASLGTPDGGRRLAFAIAYAAAGFVALIVTRAMPTRRAIPLAVAFVVTLTVLMSAHYASVPKDTGLAATGFIALVVGVVVLLPWGTIPQLIVGATALVEYLFVGVVAPTPEHPRSIPIVMTIVPVSVVAARLLARSRATTFERGWLQEQLLALSRALAARDAAAVSDTVLVHALPLLAADTACCTLWNPAREVFRVEAVRSTANRDAEWIVGLEVPRDYPMVRTIVARDDLVLPADDPRSPLLPFIEEHGSKHVLWVAMRYAGQVEGVLTFTRRTGDTFTPADRTLARGIADQAVLALRTARQVAELRRANEYKSEFVSTMSHELRTPLNVMLGYADMIEDEALDADERHDATDRLKRAGRQLLELIENTLEIGRIDSGRGDPRRETVWLPGFWNDAREACAGHPRRASVALRWSDDVPDVSLFTDPRKLSVIIRNLVGNALKFTDAGHVDASISLEADAVTIRVADTGVGIPEDHLETIFEMFRQVDQSDSRRHGGTGLGLYIVRRFAEQLGGQVSIESEPGRGSTFAVRLPVGSASDKRIAA